MLYLSIFGYQAQKVGSGGRGALDSSRGLGMVGGERGGVGWANATDWQGVGLPPLDPSTVLRGERPLPSGWIPALCGRDDPPKADRLPSRGLGGPDAGFGLEGGPGEPEVVAVDYGG